MKLEDIESRSKFEFSDDWKFVIKYDDSADHKKIKDAVQNTKAVDFIGILGEDRLVLIEVKNYRGSDQKFRADIGSQIYLQDILQKFRDSITGIVIGAMDSTNNQAFFKDCLDILLDKTKYIEAMLWLEPSSISAKMDKKMEAKTQKFRTSFKKGMRKWLSCKVTIANKEDNPYQNFLTVEFISDQP